MVGRTGPIKFQRPDSLKTHQWSLNQLESSGIPVNAKLLPPTHYGILTHLRCGCPIFIFFASAPLPVVVSIGLEPRAVGFVVGVGSGECWGEGYRSVIHGACVSTSSQITRSILSPLTTLPSLLGNWSRARDKSHPKGMEGNYAGYGTIGHGVEWR